MVNIEHIVDGIKFGNGKKRALNEEAAVVEN